MMLNTVFTTMDWDGVRRDVNRWDAPPCLTDFQWFHYCNFKNHLLLAECITTEDVSC